MGVQGQPVHMRAECRASQCIREQPHVCNPQQPLACPAATIAMQTLDYDGKIEGVDPDDDGTEHYRLVRMPEQRCSPGCILASMSAPYMVHVIESQEPRGGSKTCFALLCICRLS